MSYHPPRVFRPTGSIGVFGANAPEEVKTLQKMMINAGYNNIRGNNLRVTGHCDPETKAAIIWYQRLLNMSPSGLIHPQETWFFTMFSQTMAPHWRPRDTGPLHVREGQVTFDAEGVDYLNGPEPFRQPTRMPAFSRILHWPESSSGVTIGRGYDMKDRSAGQIMSELRQAEFEEYKVVICSKAAGLYGRHAREFVDTYRPLVGEITHQQQIRIFEISYQQKRDYARIFYIRFSGEIPGAPSWENLEQCIKD
ncbi:hypothetical protein GCM10023078_03720 [Gibbsiella greigii]